MIKQEIQAINEVCGRFAAHHIGPHALEADLASDGEFARYIWKKSCEIGLPSLLVPEESGGAGQSADCAAMVVDMLAGECAGIASVFAHHYAACICLEASGAPAWSSLLTELAGPNPWAGGIILPSDYDSKRLSVDESGGMLHISGTSPLFCNACVGSRFIAFIESADDGMWCVLVNSPLNGLIPANDCGLPGLKANPFVSTIFGGNAPADEQLLARGQEAKELYRRTLDAYFGLIAACSIGAARSAFSKAYTYARERYQYGKNIIHHQEIQRMLGNMLAKLSVGTSAYNAVFNGESPALPLFRPDGRFAKTCCTDSAVEIALDAVQIHGGYGYTHDYGVEKILRDVRTLSLLGGSTPAMHMAALQRMINEG